MTNIDIKNLAALLTIAQKAIDVQIAKEAEQPPRDAFGIACNAFKRANGIDFIAKNTPDWDDMCEATADEYAVLTRAERVTYNARRRLGTAIRAYRRSEVAA